MTADDPLPPGFSDVEQLTTTGCGPLYRALVATADGRVENVAVTLVKTPVRDRGARRRLRSECLAAVALNAEPDVLAVRDLGFTEDHRPFLVTDLPSSGTLADRLQQSGPLPIGEAVAMGSGLARALASAHRQGILHLGISPDVVFAAYGERPLLGHFGLAWAVRPPTQPAVPALTIVHAPRELFGWEEPTVGSDVYGLASVLRTAISGQAPFETEARIGRAALYHRLVQGAPAPMAHPGVPEALAQLLNRMMDPDPGRRPAVEEVGRALEEISRLPGMAVAPRRVGAVPPTNVQALPRPAGAPITDGPMELPPPAGAPILEYPMQPATGSIPAQPQAGPPIVEGPTWPGAAPIPTQPQAALPNVEGPTQPPAGPPVIQTPARPAPIPAAGQPSRLSEAATKPIPLHTAAQAEPRQRNTGLVILAAAGLAALAAGVAWGVATAPKKTSSTQQPGPLVTVPTFDAAHEAAYQVRRLRAVASGGTVTVTWDPPKQVAGIQNYFVTAVDHNATASATLIGNGVFSATFSDLKSAATDCYSVAVLAVAPGDSVTKLSQPATCVIPTTARSGAGGNG